MLEKTNNCYYAALDSGLHIVSWNEKFKSLFNESAIKHGDSFLALLCPFCKEQWEPLINKVLQDDEKPVTTAIPLSHEKNSVINWNIWKCADASATKSIEMLGVLISAEESKKTGITEEVSKDGFVRSLFDSNPDPVITFDLKGKVVKVNQAFLDLSGYTLEEVLENEFSSIIDEAKNEDVKEYFYNAAKGSVQKYDTAIITKSGKRIFLSVTNIPVIECGNIIGVNGFAKDITQVVMAREVLVKQETRLKSVLSKLRRVLDSSLDMICAVDENGNFTEVSAASTEVLGYEPKEILSRNFYDFLYEEDRERTVAANLEIKSGKGTTNFENRYYKKDGSIAYLTWSSRWDEGDKRFYCTARDATKRKLSEEALRSSEEKYKILFNDHPHPNWIYDVETFKFIDVNKAAILHLGYSKEEFLNLKLTDILAPGEVDKFRALFKQKDYYKVSHRGLWIHKKKNNETFYAEISSNFIEFNGRKAKIVLSVDRTEQVMAEKELIKSNEKYLFLSEATFDAIYDQDFKLREVQWNEVAKRMFGNTNLPAMKAVDWWNSNLHEDDRERVEAKIKEHIDKRLSHWEDEYRFRIQNGEYIYIYDRGYIIYDEQDKPQRMIGAMQDLTERKAHEIMLQKLNVSLEKRARELAESNSELERFAYVASHDLQEPLRMVTSFLQLLEKRYKDKLDQKANEYINYAVDGAERMKRLILDLLEYSRVNSSKIEKEDVDVSEVVNELKVTYRTILLETHGSINAAGLPVVKGNKTQILQLFQNLIGNAFKYRSERPPVVDISVEEEQTVYKFLITDNGIGISPKFFNKIFIIFQRLHNREQYSGTGIGLAICKKIIDKHGGKIWVSSTPGQGSTFYFTLPKSK